MADLGSIGIYGNELQGNASQQPCLRMMIGGVEELLMGGKDTVEGNGAPCLRIETPVTYKIRWAMVAGSRTLSIDVKQAINVSPRPRVTVKANTDIGVNSDVSASAGSSAGWVTIGPISVSPTSDGVLEVWLENLYAGGDSPAYWDNLAVT